MPKYQARSDAGDYPISEDDLAGIDRALKTVRLKVNGQPMSFRLLDETDQAIDALGFSTAETVLNKDVHAPMPGLVLDILVEEGSEVSAGTPLLILEAMKMENVLKAEGDGTVKAISIKKGQAVEKKQLLITVD